MVGDRREYFTTDGVAAMKWELTRAAIANAIEYHLRSNSNSPCYSGDMDKGYLLSPYHSDGACSAYRSAYPSGYPKTPEPPPEWNHYRLPAIPKTRTDRPNGTITVEDVYGNPTGEKFDAWADSPGSSTFPFHGSYRKWSNQIEELFFAWSEADLIPYERNFWDAADQVRDAIKKLEVLNCQGESYYLACSSLGLIETYSPGESAGSGRMWAPQIDGPIDLFIIPLQGTFLNLAVFAEMLAAQLEGLGNMWQNARQGVMEIGWYATQRLFGRPGATDLKELIHGAGYLLAAVGFLKVPTPVSIGVTAASIFLTGAEDLIGEIQKKDADVAPFGVTITAGSTEHVLEQVRTALYGSQENCLQEALESDEGKCIGMLQVAQHHFESGTTVYDAKRNSYSTMFTLKPSNILNYTADDNKPPNVDIQVEFDRLRKAGSIFADELSRDLHDIAYSLRGILPGSSAWERPEIAGGMGVGIGWTGPWEPWNANRILLAEALEKTALQAVDVGDYLISAANFLERKDTAAQEALEQAGAKLDGQFGSS
jgi:hypothetical protein